jgi:hypothetical protein
MLEAPAGAAPAHGGFADRRVPVSPRGQIARANRRLAFPAGLEPACLRVRSALLIRLSYGKMNMIGSRRTIRTCLSPLTAERLHRDGSTGMRWWSNGESNSGRRSCKDQLQPAACPELVPSARFELASCVLQTRAITRFANWAKALLRMARTSVIETDSPEWHSGARPSSYVRIVVGNPGIEPGRHTGAGFTGPLSPPT